VFRRIGAAPNQRTGDRAFHRRAGGEINVPAEVLYGEANQGFAVRFVDMPDGVHELLRKELDRKLSG